MPFGKNTLRLQNPITTMAYRANVIRWNLDKNN